MVFKILALKTVRTCIFLFCASSEIQLSGKTSSVARNIDGEERVEEIARMLSGDANTQQSLDHARAMLLKYSGGN